MEYPDQTRSSRTIKLPNTIAIQQLQEMEVYDQFREALSDFHDQCHLATDPTPRVISELITLTHIVKNIYLSYLRRAEVALPLESHPPYYVSPNCRTSETAPVGDLGIELSSPIYDIYPERPYELDLIHQAERKVCLMAAIMVAVTKEQGYPRPKDFLNVVSAVGELEEHLESCALYSSE